jgi:alkyl sulfatase BDS1-like metallo-beta-lactamase superfamily hydrolase
MAKGKAVPLWLSVLKDIAKDVKESRELKDTVISVAVVFKDQKNESLSFTLDHGKLTAQEGIPDNLTNVSKVILDSKIFERIVTEKTTPLEAFQKKKVQIDGDIAILPNLIYLFPLMKASYEKIAQR